MDWLNIAIVFICLLTMNFLIYLYFIRYAIKKSNAGLVFIGINTVKDFIWLVVALNVLEKSSPHFFMIIIIFITLALPLFYKVIRKLNQL